MGIEPFILDVNDVFAKRKLSSSPSCGKHTVHRTAIALNPYIIKNDVPEVIRTLNDLNGVKDR